MTNQLLSDYICKALSAYIHKITSLLWIQDDIGSAAISEQICCEFVVMLVDNTITGSNDFK